MIPFNRRCDPGVILHHLNTSQYIDSTGFADRFAGIECL